MQKAPSHRLRRKWELAPLCGAEATFSGSSKDPSLPLYGENSTRSVTHAGSYSQAGRDCRENGNNRLKDEFPSFFFHGIFSV